jgi:hypothetical protein
VGQLDSRRAGPDLSGVLERVYIDAEAVVLRGDFDLSGFEIFNGVISAAMAEFELECLAAESKP